MQTISAAVYASPGPGMPELAVIIKQGEVIFAKAVPNLKAGEAILVYMLQSYKKMAAAESKK